MRKPKLAALAVVAVVAASAAAAGSAITLAAAPGAAHAQRSSTGLWQVVRPELQSRRATSTSRT